MLPRPESVLVRFEGSDTIYVVEEGEEGEGSFVLRPIVSEEVARDIYGDSWFLYVLTLPSDTRYAYTLGATVEGPEEGLVTDLTAEAALLGNVTYELYLINPDGTRRGAFLPGYATFEHPDADTTIVGIEDKGSDFDFNDVVFEVKKVGAFGLIVNIINVDSLWNHQLGISVFYDGALVADDILWEDSHASLHEVKSLDLRNVEKLKNPETHAEEVLSLGFRTPFSLAYEAYTSVVSSLSASLKSFRS
jgi:hypothetical protein